MGMRKATLSMQRHVGVLSPLDHSAAAVAVYTNSIWHYND